MKKLLKITFFFIFISSSLSSQTIKDIDISEDKTLIRSFDSLPKNEYLDSLALVQMKKKRYNSILGCILQIKSDEKDSIHNNNINKRLKDFAEKLFAENKYVILIGGSECGSYVKETNINGKLLKIYYLCINSGCITTKELEKAKEEFNTKSKSLLGWKEEEKNGIKKKRKNNK